VQLLEGDNASLAALRKALLKAPEVLHFAVHVVSPKDRPQEAALALSLTADDIPELLTREAIAEFRVPGSLVILDGCSSQQGETLPSAGLIGLSRAWLLAGASAVIVSAWPTPDDSGRFFSSFYNHFRPLPSTFGSLAKRAALALQQAQLEMRRSNGYGSSPSFWAAYSVISKE
jgi:CHAT domain-containing protein